MSATIAPYLNGTAFDPELTYAMGEAYDCAFRALHDRGQPAVVREVVAKRIIEIAKTGERDPNRLCERALQTFGIDAT